MRPYFDELFESWINGNTGYVASEIRDGFSSKTVFEMIQYITEHYEKHYVECFIDSMINLI